MSFGAPEWLWALCALPVLALLFLRAERRGLRRLREFVSPHLLPQLSATVNRPRRLIRFGLQLLGLACAVLALAQPRWGYVFQNVKREGLDLLIAIDVSRSMNSNDVQPSRLERAKLAAQDLINELQGDRAGLIAFAGSAFLQAPLTIDYGAVIDSINDLDVKTIPEGGTNISQAIDLAVRTFGKSAMGNRALIIFTDGEELTGDAVDAAKGARDAGVRIFTLGVGTPQGSLIPITGEDGNTAFVKDPGGQVVKSKLDEKRLREIAQRAGGLYLHLDAGPGTIQRLYTEGLAKMQAAQIDVRSSRHPIERYEWPLSLALLALALSVLITERKRVRAKASVQPMPKVAAAAAVLIVVIPFQIKAASPGIDEYQDGQFNDAYMQFQDTLKKHPDSHAEASLQFDAGAAAYKLKNYNEALQAFSQALLSPDKGLQTKSHYNLGNTLYRQGEGQQSNDKKLTDWINALQHYEQAIKLDPNNREAKENYQYVKKKIEELKKKKPPTPTPTPTPTPPSPPQKNKNNSQGGGGGGGSQNQQNQKNNDQQKSQNQQKNSQNQSSSNQNQSQQKNQSQNQQKNESQNQQKDQSQNQQQQNEKSGATPSPSPGQQQNQNQQSSSGQNSQQPASSPSMGENERSSPSPSPDEEGQTPTPSAAPNPSPAKKLSGEIKGAGGDQSKNPATQPAEVQPEKEGEMSPEQAKALLESMKDEETRVQLDEHRATHRVYKDW